MAGRMAGWLMVCDPPHQSAGDLADALGASASSVSGAARILVEKGLVERIGVPGERRAHFRIREDAWTPTMNGWLVRARHVRELAEDGIRALKGEGSVSLDRLTELRDFHRFLERTLPELLDRWKRERVS
jgi:DNA-binding transcriptional regulator GbsR (MarR family)